MLGLGLQHGAHAQCDDGNRLMPTPAEPKRSLWARSRGVRFAGFWFFVGAVVASVCLIYVYDPTLLGWKPTVDHPLKPSDPLPGTFVVDPLSHSWDFDGENVPWEPVLPLAQISDSAYKEGSELEAILHKWGLTTIQEFPVGAMYAYVASNDKVVVVAFRGTNSDQLADWIADAKITRDPVEHGQIHRGFYRSTKGMLGQITVAVKEQGGERKKVWVTGHSLGGAMALVFAYDCITTGSIEPVGVVTFGQPLVVDRELAGFLNKELKGKYLRFVHGGDLVPRVFPTFTHCGNRVWFVNGSYEFSRSQPVASAAGGTEADKVGAAGVESQTMTEREFEALKKQLKNRNKPVRGIGRRRQIQPAEAPAFLADHFMSGYLHWIVKLSDQKSPGLEK